MLVEDGVVKVLNLEEGGAFRYSSAEEILAVLWLIFSPGYELWWGTFFLFCCIAVILVALNGWDETTFAWWNRFYTSIIFGISVNRKS